MLDRQTLMNLLSVLSWLLPMLLVYLVGSALALTRRAQHPRRSTLALCAFALLALGLLASAASQVMIVLPREVDRHTLQLVLMIAGAIRMLLDLAGWVLLLCALFAREKTQP